MTGLCYLGIFKSMVAGDQALYRLIQRRYEQLGIGGECYPNNPEHLQELIGFLPRGQVNTAHLPYHYDITNPEHFSAIVACAAIGNLRGFTLHDQNKYTAARKEFIAAAERLSNALAQLPNTPAIFFEFTGQGTRDDYRDKMAALINLPHIYPCIDVGHVAVDFCRTELETTCPNLDQTMLSPDYPGLPEIIGKIQAAVIKAQSCTLNYIGSFCAMKWAKMHFHTHNVHPLSKFSQYPIRDHLSYLKQIPLPFTFNGRQVVDGVFNATGARLLNARWLRAAKRSDISVMLEIHTQPGRLPLGPDADIFSHWEDLTTAETMNYHLDLVAQCLSVLTS